MLYVCVRGVIKHVMDVVFSVCLYCIVTRGDVGGRVWEVLMFRHAYVACLCRSQCCMLHDLQFVNAG